PTATAGNNSTQLANTAFVNEALVAVIGGAPTTLDTLKEIATAINNDPNFSATINNALALKAPLASPAMTGTPTAPTAAQTVNNTQIATTAFVKAAIAALVASSPAALDTLNELAKALGNDPNFATTMTNALAGKQPLDNTLTALSGKSVAALLEYLGLGKTDSPEFGGLKAPKVILRDGDVNLISGANNLVIQVGGNDVATLTPGNNFFKGKVTAETTLQVGSTCQLGTDGNLTGSKWGGWLDAFMKDGMSTDGNGLWWDAFSSQLQFRIGGFNIADAAGGAGTSVTFPKAFKNGCLIVIPVPGNGGAAQQIGSQSYSSSGAVLQKGASDNSPRSGKYLAIGY
ncbi:TPA: phage tail protein, partial [Citrobacter freundii]